ncbi:PAB-dependent poly(A)-specific ribonuclease subunit 2 [Wickerhamomyces ciferrii]|uniref:PAN2-PAN3 deadenylation complex catalytic subunit PAN2 n=1 Tax=Wickerhamomyces ciferrii (strain ATCC 14091 / BCRC 22168 / CBS 111 / JCM 3599 / NBRC 0793 / NRRL Y-1031 F-60-10) TaxID=1206466 RepID=K0KZL9_WICCF|nr:PAB-dependent poly(A)-specific ribonuclease subunit 2 [Wickerhamomyces ciferrii]CCH46608.1 PAB-dependent poly(A)-specific ribonuclease subunit 2 [Wickerhamomyces ciferrii]
MEGWNEGFIASYTGQVLSPYTRFPGHKGAVKQLLSHHKGVISIDDKSLKLTNRRGLVLFQLTPSDHPSLEHICAMEFISPNEIIVATTTALLRIETHKGKIVKELPYSHEVVLISSSKRYVALGKVNGSVDIFDPKSDTIVKTFISSSGKLSDIDLKEHTLVTCGFSQRHGTYVLDPLVNVYDLRTLKPLAPIAFPAGASFVRLHPKLSSVAFIASKTGQLQIVDMFNPTNVSLFQIDARPMVTKFELSSTGDFLAIADGYSLLHLWSHNPEHSSMSSKIPLEYPTMPETNTTPISIDDDVPLNTIGMPYYKETLLSAWPAQTVFRSAGTLPKTIDSSILQNAQNIDGLLIAPYDKEKYGRRNLAKKYVSVKNNNESNKFKSFKASNIPTSHKSPKEQENLFEIKESDAPDKPPPAFKKLEILYSKFGVGDFDFDSYNSTHFTGLEVHVDNAYTNSLLQLYRFVPEIFNFVLGNLAIENLEPNSILRELGYLYDMMVKSFGHHFRPTNFQQALLSLDDAIKSGLVDKDNDSTTTIAADVGTKIKVFNRVLLDNLVKDEMKQAVPQSRFLKSHMVFGIEIETRIRSMFTGAMSTDINIVNSLDLLPPHTNTQKLATRHALDPSILAFIESSTNIVEQRSILNEVSGQLEAVEINHAVRRLPPVVSFNLHLKYDDLKAIRGIKNWLRPKFYAAHNKGRISIYDDVKNSLIADSCDEYGLVGYVAEVSGESDKDKHLVTFVKIHNDFEKKTEWYLFNDFLVTPIPESEALNLSYWWKKPVTLIYRNSKEPGRFDYAAWSRGLNDQILYRDHFAAGTREGKRIEYEMLTKEEAPQPGTLIAIDAEFVTLEEEQFELKSNGTRSMLKPSKQTLARVSVLRGDDGPQMGVPFIDDYVVVQEGIHDYLTSFSGIEPGDLDPATSDKSLVNREVVYRKLWLLINLGCVFVGHGLNNDFRTINISVPKAQVRDTAVFFYKGQRILSLRFLAYILLDKKVQAGNHDSIEDAHTALLLYKEYLKLKQSGNFETILDNIYNEGQALKFKPPENF